jgi:Amino acid synthesis
VRFTNLGKPMRTAIGGGKAVISSNVKVAAAGASLDVPLGHRDDSWSFNHLDTITVSAADAPRPNEIVVVMAIADGDGCGTDAVASQFDDPGRTRVRRRTGERITSRPGRIRKSSGTGSKGRSTAACRA